MKKIVIGMGFGDEGKGRTVDYLSSIYNLERSLVIRFSGGQQAAHSVYLNKEECHLFSSFGSGTLRNIPTYISKYCTVDPVAIINEYNHLNKFYSKKCNPILYVDGKCPVTTPYDKLKNLNDHQNIKNGSCGAGFGTTLQREEDFYSLLFEDLFHPEILKIKLNLIKEYYKDVKNVSEKDISDFFLCCYKIKRLKNIIKSNEDILKRKKNLFFEGSQGLLLDQNIGFFPHVTRSNTDLTNIKKLSSIDYGDLYLVTRAYQTRHGNGPMTNEKYGINYKNPYELNVDFGTQGKFRSSILDLDLLKYSYNKLNYSAQNLNIILVITCLDLVLNKWKLTENGKLLEFHTENDFVGKISSSLGIGSVLLSRNPYGDMDLYW